MDEQPKVQRHDGTVFGLARTVLGSAGFLETTAAEHAAIVAAKVFISEVLSFEGKFDLLVSNYLELEKTLGEMALDHMIRSEYDFHSMQDCLLLINLRVQNFLSACRLYLDHGAHHVGNMDATVPALSAYFKALRSREYDDSAAYRIAEALRNHSQHRGFPICSFSTGGGWVERDGGQRVNLHRVDVRIDHAGMQEGGRTKKSVLMEIEALGKSADARPIFREYIECLGRIHEAIRSKLKYQVQACENCIEEGVDRYRNAFPNETSVVGLAAVARNPDGTWASRNALVPDLIGRRRHFQTRNSSLANLSCRHVSTEPALPRKNSRQTAHSPVRRRRVCMREIIIDDSAGCSGGSLGDVPPIVPFTGLLCSSVDPACRGI